MTTSIKGVDEANPLHVWIPTDTLIAILERNLDGLIVAGSREHGMQNWEDALWIGRRVEALNRLRSSHSPQQYVALYPLPDQEG